MVFWPFTFDIVVENVPSPFCELDTVPCLVLPVLVGAVPGALVRVLAGPRSWFMMKTGAGLIFMTSPKGFCFQFASSKPRARAKSAGFAGFHCATRQEFPGRV